MTETIDPVRRGLAEPPKEITVCNLEVVVMPNGEIICNGGTVGWVGSLGKFVTPLLADGQAPAVPPTPELEQTIDACLRERGYTKALKGSELYEDFRLVAKRCYAIGKAEASGVPASPQWLPIETAPTNGTRILACWNGADARVVAWRKKSGARTYRWWQDHWTDFVEPTHWMPLPDPPGATDTPSETK